MLIKRLDRYIFSELLGPFLGGMLGAFCITSFGPLLRAVKLLTDGTVATSAIGAWFLYRIPEDMQFIFPVAMLLTTLLTFGRLSKDSEITAMRAAGISLGRLLYPVAFFGCLVTVGVFFFLDRVVPPSMYNSQRIWERDIRKETEARYREHILLKRRDGGLIYVGRLDLQTKELEKVLIRNYAPQGATHRDHLLFEQTAERARWVGTEGGKNLWHLWGVRFRHHGPDGSVSPSRVAELTIPLDEGLSDLLRTEYSDPRELSFRQLVREIRYLEERGLANTTPLKVELYVKTSFPFCILIFALMGATMGLSSSRSGGAVGFGVSLVVTFLYYIAMSLSTSFGKTGTIDPLLSAWLHNFIFFGFALYNVVRVQNR